MNLYLQECTKKSILPQLLFPTSPTRLGELGCIISISPAGVIFTSLFKDNFLTTSSVVAYFIERAMGVQ